MKQKKMLILVACILVVLVVGGVVFSQTRAPKEDAKAEKLFTEMYQCPNEAIAKILAQTGAVPDADGTVLAEPPFSEALIAHAHEQLDGVVAPEYFDSLLTNLYLYQLRCIELGATIEVKSITLSPLNENDRTMPFRLALLYTSSTGETTDASVTGSVRFNAEGLIENLYQATGDIPLVS